MFIFGGRFSTDLLICSTQDRDESNGKGGSTPWNLSMLVFFSSGNCYRGNKDPLEYITPTKQVISYTHTHSLIFVASAMMIGQTPHAYFFYAFLSFFFIPVSYRLLLLDVGPHTIPQPREEKEVRPFHFDGPHLLHHLACKFNNFWPQACCWPGINTAPFYCSVAITYCRHIIPRQ